MDTEAKRSSILKRRRHEISKEYARRRKLEEDKDWSLNTEEVTISIENLQSHLTELTKDITIEKHQRLIGEFKQFFDELGDDQNILFEIINVYKEKKGITELDADPESVQELHNKVQSKIPKIKTRVHKEIRIETTTTKDTWDNFNNMVQRTGLNQKDCISLSLRLFVDYCTKILAEDDNPSKKTDK